MIALDLFSRLMRGGGRRDRQTTLLSALAVAVAVAVMVAALTIGVIGALVERDQRTDWTRPAATKSAAIATQSTSTIYLDGTPVTVVRISPAGDSASRPAPPGLDSFPAPGTVAWSPALRKALADRPKLAQTLGAARSPVELGKHALTGPGQLVAVLGVKRVSGPAWQDLRFPGSYSPSTKIADFSGTPGGNGSDTGQYLPLGWIAAVLLVVPVLTLTGAAARLGAQRRGVRIASLRLAGADARDLRSLVALEAAVVVGAGVVLGSAFALLLARMLAFVSVGGTRFYAGDLVPGPLGWIAIIAGAAALITTSSLAAIRRPIADPLAVLSTHEKKFSALWRLAVGMAAVAAFTITARSDDANVAMICGALGCLFLVLNALGPLLVNVAGRLLLRRSTRGRTSQLLAARRILEDPQGVWRVIAGVCLASFVAGFLALFSTADASKVVQGTERGFEVAVPAASADRAVARTKRRLARAGLSAPVQRSAQSALVLRTDGEPTAVRVELPRDPDVSRQIRDTVTAEFPHAPAATGLDVAQRSGMVVADFARATLIVLAVSFLVAAVACGITVAASVLDRREVYRLLWQAGVPLDVLDRARTTETILPLAAGATLAALGGLTAAMPITLSTGLSARGGVTLALTIALGIGGVLLGIRASRPLLIASATPAHP